MFYGSSLLSSSATTPDFGSGLSSGLWAFGIRRFSAEASRASTDELIAVLKQTSRLDARNTQGASSGQSETTIALSTGQNGHVFQLSREPMQLPVAVLATAIKCSSVINKLQKAQTKDN